MRRGGMLGFAVLFIPALVWMGMVMEGGKIVSEDKVNGRVQSIEALPVKDPSQSKRFKVGLKLPDGTQAHVMVYERPPEPGSTLKLVVYTQADGKRIVRHASSP